MEQILLKAGRIFYGIMIIGLGCQQIFYADFRPVILPSWSALAPWFAYVSYLFSMVFIAGGIAIIAGKKVKEISLILGGLFFGLFLLGHVTYELTIDPYSRHLGAWTNALKELVLSGGGFVIAGSFPSERADDRDKPSLIWFLEKFIPLGPVFFSITMILFGIAHFFYAVFVSALVPDWIPGHLFWTYFAGVALAGGGIAIILRIKLKQVAF